MTRNGTWSHAMGQRSLQVSASYTPSVFQDLKYPRVQLELKLSILHYIVPKRRRRPAWKPMVFSTPISSSDDKSKWPLEAGTVSTAALHACQ